MLKQDIWFKVLFGITILAFLGDLGSTLLNWGLIKYLEANPLYKYGGLALPIVLNISFMALYYFLYRNTKNVSTRFMIIFGLVAIITTRVIVIRNNLWVWQHPPTLEQAMAITSAQKMETMKELVVLNILPFLNGLFAWFIFKGDHKIERK